MSPDAAPILQVGGLVKRFGGFHALDGLSFQVSPGEILGLVGPNGSGKTTAINVISGLYAPDAGQVLFDRVSIGGMASHKIVHRGINRTFQVPKPFMALTVRQNVQVSLAYGRAAGAPAIADLLDECRLTGVIDRPAGELNNAQQKMLDLVRALATRPRLLLLDELAAGFNPAELDWIAQMIKALASRGMAIIVVEHLMGFIEQITDRVTVLNAGREIFEGKLAVAVNVPEVIEVFLGASVPLDAPPPLLEAEGVNAGYGSMQVLWGVDLDVAPGETVLLLGANGAGKTTFLKTLVGLVEAKQGHIRIDGADVTRMRASDRMRLGMTYMSELAVFPDLSIEENLRVGALALGHANPGARAEYLYGLFPVLRDKRRAPASSLSGGQRKMLGIAKALASEPRLLVMDEPSAGLSPRFVKDVIHVLGTLQAHGLALLIAEQNIGFLDVATRVSVLEGGRIRFSGTVAEMTDNEALRRAYFGLK